MTHRDDRDSREFDSLGNTRPTGSNYIADDSSDDDIDRRGGAFKPSPVLDTGQRFTAVVHAGVQRYFCSLHPMMQGQVVAA